MLLVKNKYLTLLIGLGLALSMLLVFGATKAEAAELGQIRVHAVIDEDANALPFFGGENHQADWKVRLYNLDWTPANAGTAGTNEVMTTGLAFNESAMFHVPEGRYHVCSVLKDDLKQSFALTINGWVSFDDNSVRNQSTAVDEGGRCIRTQTISEDEIRAYVFGHNQGGELRVHQVIDKNNNQWPDFNGDEIHAKNWRFRLYKINHQGEWVHWGRVKSTGEAYNNSANFKVASGKYRICEVVKDGYSQSYIRRVMGYFDMPEIGVNNESPIMDSEHQKCAPVELKDGEIKSYIFGDKLN